MHSAGFNPRTHTGCGHVHLLHVASIFCFNPRTTQGSTFWVVPCIVIMLVSILAHRVRLPSLTRKIQTFVVSIHAPTRGATQHQPARRTAPARFNPRTHTGCDPETWTANILKSCFNPRTHTGCDMQGILYCQPTRFQSTHPHGVRL